ncbi:MAG: rhodanese-like domain-containing protein [Euryarchaeota archaeon]|nr:rhodanese-like domain-containing protein [Euryarchaeota archaeon]
MTTVQQLIAEARPQIEGLDVAAMAAELKRPGVVLVDVREPDERAQHGTIPGAMAAPRGMLEFYADPSTPYHKKELDPKARILLFCAAGSRSALAGATLHRMGFENVAHLEGGFKAWAEAGHEVAPVQR